MAAKVERYESLLAELLPVQDINRQQEIRNALSERNYMEEDSVSGDEVNDDEHSVSATVGSPRFQDRAQQSATVAIGSAGYLGKSSVVHWIEELKVKLATSKLLVKSHGVIDLPEDLSRIPDEANIHEISILLSQDCTYFSNETSQAQISGIPDSISAAFQLPPKPTAKLLISSFFSSMQSVFPILAEKRFMLQYDSYCRTRPPNVSYMWVAILNVVFAIGALYIEHIGMPCDCAESHIVYWIRSRLLGQEPIQMIGLPTMEHIQLLTISGMYCIATYQINRASYLVALGVRYAYSQALHLVNTSPDITDEERDYQVLVWHSLCSVERLLSLLTGLPSSIQDRFISTRLPRATDSYYPLNPPVDNYGAQPPMTTMPMSSSRKASVSYHLDTFVAGLLLDTIANDTLVALYSSSTVNRTWARIQQIVVDLDKRLSQWQSDLSPGLTIPPSSLENMPGPPLADQIYLSLRYLGARMLINRPGFCDIHDMNLAIPSQSDSSRRLDQEAAMRCISSARAMVQLLPVHLDAAEFYRSTPWWCSIHYLVQAGVVLIMEISFDGQHIPTETDHIISESVLLVRWLEVLSTTNDSANRAFLSLNHLLKLALEKAGRYPGRTTLFPTDASNPEVTRPVARTFQSPESNFLSGTTWDPALPS